MGGLIERYDGRTNPRTIGGDKGLASIVSRTLGKKHACAHGEKRKEADDCPYECDPIKVFGSPKLSSPYFALDLMLLLLGFMYFSDKGLERRPFGARHVRCWVGGFVTGVFHLKGVELDLTDDETAALERLLSDAIDRDRYPLSPRVKTLKGILAKIKPERRPEPLPPIKHYEPPRTGRYRRR
jgi:hypothetical protein